MRRLTRRVFVARVSTAFAALAVPLRARARIVPLLGDVGIASRGTPFAGDHIGVATVSVASGSSRDAAMVEFRLARRAAVTLDVLATGRTVQGRRVSATGGEAIASSRVTLGAGRRRLMWRPDPGLAARTYILRLSAWDGARKEAARVVARVLGIDAGFTVRSARAGDVANLVVRADAGSLTVQILRVGLEAEPTYSNDVLPGVPVTEASTVDWQPHRNGPFEIHVRVGSWPSGVYAARLESEDGRLGFAPLVVSPSGPQNRVAVVLPTMTWQAYNFYDADGDGWGDTWYARWRVDTVDLARPHATRGVPNRFRSYDLGFLHWLAHKQKAVDFYAEDDIEAFASAAALRSAYDLLVYPGHTEYVTERLLDLMLEYRNLGGRLMFLSANNFFRRIDRAHNRITLVDEWRTLGRPEAALCGIQYVASDLGTHQEPFVVTGAAEAPWAFEGTGLTDGSQFGRFGIEIDGRARSSPPGVQVLAHIPDLLGPGRTAEMTYYETPRGARVFSAGALNFGGQVLLWPETTQLLENVWNRLTAP
jgi:hypothetical protein